MEKRVCKLCNKSFSNGRALGGHMRSHMATLQPLPPPPHPPPPPPPLLLPPNKSSTESATSSTSSSSSSDGEDKGLGYGLRENPKKSFRLVDPEFSFLVDAGSSVVQDRESETESSKNPSRRRSKRTRKSLFIIDDKKLKLSTVESVVEPEQPMSSVSDTSPEEDVARCLMMLSRATWDQNEDKIHDDEYDDDGGDEEEEEDEKSLEDSENDDEDDDLEQLKIIPTRNRAKYQCGTCKKMFKSYQALGGHRASHKKIKACFTTPPTVAVAAVRNEVGSSSRGGPETGAGAMGIVPYQRIHECPICFRVFKSGQALGGHKRSHITGSATPITHRHNTNSVRFRDNLIDLNLPAPMDDDDYSQVELSAVSDAEFIK